MKKRILTFILAFTMLFASLGPVALASEKTSNEAKIKSLVDRNIVEGDENGQLNLQDPIKRNEITKIIVYSLGYKDQAKALQDSPSRFTDVDVNHWANGVIQVGSSVKMPNGNLIINGYGDGTFRPNNFVTNAELIKMLVVAVKDDLTNKQMEEGKWPDDYVKWAREEKIIGPGTGVEDLDLNEEASREVSFVALYNALEKLDSKKKDHTSRQDKDQKPKKSSGKATYNWWPEYTYRQDPVDKKPQEDPKPAKEEKNSLVYNKEVYEKDQKYLADGKYYGENRGFRSTNEIPVIVTVKNGKIAKVELDQNEIDRLRIGTNFKEMDHPDSDGYGKKAIEVVDQINEKIKEDKANSFIALGLEADRLTEQVLARAGEDSSKEDIERVLSQYFERDFKFPETRRFRKEQETRRAIMDYLGQGTIYPEYRQIDQLRQVDATSSATATAVNTFKAVDNALAKADPNIAYTRFEIEATIDRANNRVDEGYKRDQVAGDPLNLDGLVVKLHKKDGGVERVPVEKFDDYEIKIVNSRNNEQFRPGTILNEENIKRAPRNGLQLALVHEPSKTNKLLRPIEIDTSSYEYELKPVGIDIRKKDGSWISLAGYPESGHSPRMTIDPVRGQDFKDVRIGDLEFRIETRDDEGNTVYVGLDYRDSEADKRTGVDNNLLNNLVLFQKEGFEEENTKNGKKAFMTSNHFHFYLTIAE